MRVRIDEGPFHGKEMDVELVVETGRECCLIHAANGVPLRHVRVRADAEDGMAVLRFDPWRRAEAKSMDLEPSDYLEATEGTVSLR